MDRFNERTLTEDSETATTRQASETPGAAAPGVPHPRATLALTSAATAVALMTYTAPMVTLPDIAAALHTPLSAQAWLLNGTPLGLAALLLVAGSLADDYGRRRIFLVSTFALGITTALSALTSSTWLFTLTRVAQGASSAALLASSLGLIVHAFPTARGRLHATGVWGAFVSGGIAVGPLVAGAMPDWRVAYGVLGAAALVVAALGLRTLSESRAPRGGRPDLAGAVTFGLALVALVAALTLGRDGWLRAPVGLLLLAAVVLVGVFALVERRGTTPMIDLSLLRHRPFLASSASGLFTGLAVIGLFSFLPTLLQQTLGLSAMSTAWLFLLWSGLSFTVALQARRLAGRVSSRHQLALGFVLHAAGCPDDAGRPGLRFLATTAARTGDRGRRQRTPERRASAPVRRVRTGRAGGDGLGGAADVPVHRVLRGGRADHRDRHVGGQWARARGGHRDGGVGGPRGPGRGECGGAAGAGAGVNSLLGYGTCGVPCLVAAVHLTEAARLTGGAWR